MIDVLAGASKKAKADSALMALMAPSCQDIFMGQSPETQKAMPRAVVRHVATTWQYGMPIAGARSRKDSTTIEFIVHGDDLTVLNRIQLRLQAIFDVHPFTLIASDGNNVSADTATLVSCMEAPGGSIESMPQPNTANKSIHRLRVRFKCEVTRHLT